MFLIVLAWNVIAGEITAGKITCGVNDEWRPRDEKEKEQA